MKFKINWKQVAGLCGVGLLAGGAEVLSQLIFHDGGEEKEVASEKKEEKDEKEES